MKTFYNNEYNTELNKISRFATKKREIYTHFPENNE